MAYRYELHFDGAAGSKSAEQGLEFDAKYRVFTDDPEDQAERVIDWFTTDPAGPLIDINTPYEYANDSYPAVFAKSITPKRERNTNLVWVIVVHYAPSVGEFVFEWIPDELELRCEDVTVTTVQHVHPVESATFWGGFTGDALLKVPLGTVTIPQNSAYMPFNPGLSKDVAGLSIRVVRRLPSIDANQVRNMMNTVNSESFCIDHCFFTLHVEPYQARTTAGTSAVRSEDGSKYWELTINMEIIMEGWRDLIVDRGIHARADLGDPDGRGGTISVGDGTLIMGVPRVRSFVDADETPLTEPVLLDGNGQALAPGAATVYTTWAKYTEADFKTFFYLQGFVQSCTP